MYTLKGAIMHKGSLSGNGHYIYASYQEKDHKWTIIDDHKIYRDVDDLKTEDGTGTLYIMTRTDCQPSKPDASPTEVKSTTAEQHPVTAKSDAEKWRQFRTFYNSNLSKPHENRSNKDQCYTLNSETEDSRQTFADTHYENEYGTNYIVNNEREEDNRTYGKRYIPKPHENYSNKDQHYTKTSQNFIFTNEREGNNRYSESRYKVNEHAARRPFQYPERQQPNRERLNNPNNNDDERYEISRKKNNIVIQGIEEQGYENDVSYVINLNKAIGNEHFDQHNILKIGRIGDERGGINRPLKVELDSYVTKLNVMRNATKLQFSGQFRQISIQHDLTRKQTIIYREIKQQSRELESRDESGNFKYRVRGPPGRWTVVKLPKN